MKRGNESKPHIAILGRCNAGKSTLMNFLAGDNAAIVSPMSGTTTDPVKRSVEILDFAPVVLIDTAGIDDTTQLGSERREKTIETLYSVDMAIIIHSETWSKYEDELVALLKEQAMPYLTLYNNHNATQLTQPLDGIELNLHHSSQAERDVLFGLIKNTLPEYSYLIPSLLGDSISAGEIVLMVCPIDSEAPAGRLILPQVQAIRDALDKQAISVVIQAQQLENVLDSSLKPKLIVTDSQIIDTVSKLVDNRYPLTTFSILFAALKGDMKLYGEGLKKVDNLCDGDKVLILESCLHQTSCEDIGRVKIPLWLKEYTQKNLSFDIVAKLSALPTDFSSYALAVQCGGCMVTRRQLQGRIHRVAAAGVPITNYGMLISKIRK